MAVSEHVLNIFAKTSASYLHCRSGKLIQTLFALPGPCYRTVTWDVEAEIFGARFQITIHVSASKRCVSLSDGRFKCVCHQVPPGPQVNLWRGPYALRLSRACPER